MREGGGGGGGGEGGGGRDEGGIINTWFRALTSDQHVQYV